MNTAGTSNLRAASAANEAAAAASAFAGLPPQLTYDARVPLVRLPIDTNATIHWQTVRVDLSEQAQQTGSTDAQKDSQAHVSSTIDKRKDVWQKALQALKEQSMDEAIKNADLLFKSYSSKSESDVLSHSLTRAQLWTEHKERDGQASLWIFEVTVPSTSKERSGSAGRNTIWSHLCQEANLTPTSGTFMLDNVYKSKSADNGTIHHSDPALLAPRQDVRQPLRLWLRALEDFFIRRWVWTREAQRSLELRDEKPELVESKAEKSTKMELDKSDEEEGALQSPDAVAKEQVRLNSQFVPSVSCAYWSSSSQCRQRRVHRMGRGVLIDAVPSMRGIFVGQSQREACLPLQGSLRCFSNDKGEVFMWTYARNTELQHYAPLAEDEDMSEPVEAILAPSARITQIVGLQTLSRELLEGNAGSTAATSQRLRESIANLLQTFKCNDEPLDTVPTDWAVCKSYNGETFLWPAQLCFKRRALEEEQTVKAHATFIGTHDAAQGALALVREAIGIKTELSDTEEEDESEGDDDSEESAREESTAEDEQIDNEGGDTTIRADVPAVVKQELLVEPAKGAMPGADRGPEPVNAEAKQGVTTTTVNDKSPVASRRLSRGGDEDVDLWGSFGFGDQDDIRLSARLPSRDGMDDGGFGLVTEDDFSFFDDAAAAFANFEAPDMSMITEEMPQDISVSQLDTEMSEGNVDNARAEEEALQRHSQYDSDSNGNSSNSISQTTMTDPPSLPGFTPGSLSTYSPTAGGVSNKTPRTPYSPNQDLADLNVTIEGEHGPQYSQFAGSGITSRDMFNTPPHTQSSPQYVPSSRDVKEKSEQEDESRVPWMLKDRRVIKSKYEDGKFALPQAPATRKSRGSRVEENGYADKDLSNARKPLAPRGVGKQNLHGNEGRKSTLIMHKSRLGAVQAEDAMSEATDDGTMSEWSSNDGDSDDETSSCTDAASSDSVNLKSYLDLIDAATIGFDSVGRESLNSIVQSPAAPSLLDALSLERSPHIPDDEIQGILARAVDCLSITNKETTLRKADSICALDVQQLYVPMAGMHEHNLAFASLLSAESEDHILVSAKQVLPYLEPPKIVAGLQDSVVAMTPFALPLWRKLRLRAANGPKEIVAYGLHAGELKPARKATLQNWFSALGESFADSGYGDHKLAHDGLLNIGGTRKRSVSQLLTHMANNDEQWSDTLASLLSRFSNELLEHKSILLYTISQEDSPTAQGAWAFCKLEGDLRNLAVQRLNVFPHLIAVRQISYDVICAPRMTFEDPANDVSRFATYVYNSLPTMTLPRYNAEDHLPAYESRAIPLCSPSFTVLPSFGSHWTKKLSAEFRLEWKAESLNFLSQGSFLHFAYHLASNPGEITAVSMIDERGNEQSIAGWRRPDQVSQTEDLRRIWAYVLQQARRARMQWRVVICKSTPMDVEEAIEWTSVINENNKRALSLSNALDVTVACVDTNMPLSIAKNNLATKFSGNHVKAANSLPTGNGPSANDKQGVSTKVPESIYIDPRRAHYLFLPVSRIALPITQDEETGFSLPLRSACLIVMPQAWSGTASARSETFGAHNDRTPSASETSAAPTSTSQLWIHVMQFVSRAPEQASANSADLTVMGEEAKATQPLASAPPIADASLNMEEHVACIAHHFQALELVARERAMLRGITCRNLPWHLGILRALCTSAE